MNTARLLVLLASLLLLASCTPLSLYPFYTEKDLVLDPGFPGIWQNQKGQKELICKESGAKGYACEVVEEAAGSAVFDVHLMRLGSDLFLDIYPEPPAIAHGFLKDHLVPAHSLGRMHREGDVLRIALLDTNWLKQRIAENRIHLPLFVPAQKDRDPVLCAPPPDLQALVRSASADPKGFTGEDEWRRAR